VPFFHGVPVEEINALAADLEWMSVPAGWTLFAQGEMPDAMYLVISGRLGAFVEDRDGRRRFVGEISANQLAGEMALLTQEPRSATVIALRNTTLVSCRFAALQTFMREHPSPQLMLRVMRVLALRLARSIHRESGQLPARTFAIVPSGVDVPVAAFLAQLVAAFRRQAKRIHVLTSEDAGRELEWFDRLEAANDAVFYTADAGVSNWTKTCLRQADCVVFVANVAADPAQNAAADVGMLGVRGVVQRRELVLIHRDRATPTRTAEWLAGGEFALHHHVRLDSAPDVDRLARMLTGRAIGVVFSGGAAKGGGHIGVIRALREAGIPIDLVGGASIGALVAGAVAQDWDPVTFFDRYRHFGSLLHARNPVGDYTIPIVALARGHRVARLLGDLFGEARIEDSWKAMFCVSSNLTTLHTAVHTHGSVARWVRASIAIPGVLPPVIDNGDVLVDGGVLNNLPIDVMAAYERGPIIAVDVSSDIRLSADHTHSETGTLWQLLGKHLRGSTASLPNIGRILWCTGMASMAAAGSSIARADFVLRPPLDSIDMLDWGAFDRAADLAHAYTLESLEGLHRSENARHFFVNG
jgi:NTE family protein